MSIVFKSDSIWSFFEPLLLVYQNYDALPLNSVLMLWELHGHWRTNFSFTQFLF
ncbi:Uncharacterised protein [Salmonella enterica subsp. enterica serovar Madelia]|nr:Uncharacterised protein [Salmonella enterica subsp. enterica serovar Madelia]